MVPYPQTIDGATMSEQFKSPYGEPFPEDKMQERGLFRVRLASVGNPDFGQDPRARKYGAEANRWQKVGSIAEASAACRKFIAETNLEAAIGPAATFRMRPARSWLASAITAGHGSPATSERRLPVRAANLARRLDFKLSKQKCPQYP